MMQDDTYTPDDTTAELYTSQFKPPSSLASITQRYILKRSNSTYGLYFFPIHRIVLDMSGGLTVICTGELHICALSPPPCSPFLPSKHYDIHR